MNRHRAWQLPIFTNLTARTASNQPGIYQPGHQATARLRRMIVDMPRRRRTWMDQFMHVCIHIFFFDNSVYVKCNLIQGFPNLCPLSGRSRKTPITIWPPLPYNTFLLISYLTEIVLLNSSDRKLNSPFSFVIQTGEKKKRFISGI